MIGWIVSATALILLTLILRALLKRHMAPWLCYALWLPVLLRLLIPVSFGASPFSTDNLLPRQTAAVSTALPAHTRQPEDIPFGVWRAQPRQVAAAPAQAAVQAAPAEPAGAEPAPAQPEADLAPVQTAAPAQARRSLPVPQILNGIWLTGAAAVFLIFALSEARLCRRLRQSRQPLPNAGSPLPAYACAAVESPCLAGFLRPAVYVPLSLAGDSAALRHVLAHELTHYRHGDLLWARLRCLCLALHWYHPLVWVAALLSRQDAELACDEGAIRRLGEAQRYPYARTLLALSCPRGESLLRPMPAMSSGKRLLRRRIARIAARPRMTALTLVLALVLSLLAAGCTFSGGETPAQEGPYYEAVYRSLDLPGNPVVGLCRSGDFLFAAVLEGETNRLYAFSADGGERRELALPGPSDASGQAEDYHLAISGLLPGAAGSAYVLCLGGRWVEGAGEEVRLTDGSSFRASAWVSDSFICRIDASGQELGRFPVEEEQLGSWRAQTDAEGNLYLIDESETLYVYAPDGSALLRMPTGTMWTQLVRLSDGRVAGLNWVGAVKELIAVDARGGRMETVLTIPENRSVTVYPGAFGWDALVNNGTSLYGVNADGERGTLATWINCDLDGNKLVDVFVEPDGESVQCLFADFYNLSGRAQDRGVATLRRVAEPPAEERTVLTLACMGLDDTVADMVLHFNRVNTQYRIEVRDYSGYNTTTAMDAGYTTLNMEITTGNAPDLFCTRDMPVQTYERLGLLEDLWPYIDADAALGGRDALVEPVFSALTQAGKLYEIAPYFQIYTVVAPQAAVGEKSGWTMAEFREAYAHMPEGCTVMDPWMSRQTALTASLCLRVEDFLDREAGTCRFDSEEFRDLIRFADLFPETGDLSAARDESFERVSRGEQMLMDVCLADFGDLTLYSDFLGDQAVYVGFPGAAGNGSAFDTLTGLAMSASCRDKDGAWSFMRLMLDRDLQLDGAGDYDPRFPTNRQAFERLLEAEMAPEYRKDPHGSDILDPAGNRVEQPRGGRQVGSRFIYRYAMTQAECDRFLALLEGTEHMRYWDDKVMDVVYEQIGAYYSGDKTLEEVTAIIQKRIQIYLDEQK